MIALPKKNCDITYDVDRTFIKDFYFEICICAVRNNCNEMFKKIIEKFKKNGHTIASLFLRLDECYSKSGAELNDFIKNRISNRIVELLNNRIKNLKTRLARINPISTSLSTDLYKNTTIPFYDILYKNIFLNLKSKRAKLQMLNGLFGF